MPKTETKEPDIKTRKADAQNEALPVAASRDNTSLVARIPPGGTKPRLRIVPILITFITVAIAGVLSWAMWNVYMAAPWTRDASVRVYVVTIAPQISGEIVQLPVADNQRVRKGDLLMVIDPTNYRIAVKQSEAALEQAKANAQDAEAQYNRRRVLTTLSVSDETKDIYKAKALSTKASVDQAVASLDQARVNLKRTEIRSPVNGYITNLLTQLGNYATAGVNQLSIVNTDSYWIDGYFEETQLASIREGDPVLIKLLGSAQTVRGHVANLARGIEVANAQKDASGLAKVNPIFTWVRLAQRVPVRIDIDEHPKDIPLVAGMTATVEAMPKNGVAPPWPPLVTKALARLGLDTKFGRAPPPAEARGSSPQPGKGQGKAPPAKREPHRSPEKKRS
jgi:multidrug resistance efflux pump